ncbi:OppA family ABC transporter substrate-binding lipoprotein [[Mycoplasma] gypis]|uniref:Uncharacterized protein n=1 Tax=[Mycoplasma] gypis TaxID=92404 RepID=A0ABZ2RQD1_9BACT|nr:hypothetical protein [[Mycoplasma] gypis]MBN0919559.1 hypothetical protein [[Mycoplasma] gypis]
MKKLNKKILVFSSILAAASLVSLPFIAAQCDGTDSEKSTDKSGNSAKSPAKSDDSTKTSDANGDSTKSTDTRDDSAKSNDVLPQEEIAKLQTVNFNQSQSLQANNFYLDTSAMISISVPQNDVANPSVAAKLFRIKTITSPKYSDIDPRIVSTPGKIAYRFELAKAITLTLEDGSTKTFDTDVYDETQKPSTQPYQMQISSNPKSINSKEFKDALKQAIQMSISIKDDVYWVDAHGNKTPYKVQAKDFWYSYLRSYFLGRFQRQEAGYNGTTEEAKKMDAHIIEKLKINKNVRFGSQLFTHNQLFEINGLSSEQFREFDKESLTPINAVKNNELVFNRDNTYKDFANFEKYWELLLTKSLLYAAAPSQYIDYLAQQPEYNTTFTYQVKEGDTTVTKELPEYGKGIVHQIGLYYYGTNFYTQNLYAGAYYPSADESNENKIVLKQNPEYWDKDWVNSNTSIKKVIIKANSNDQSTDFQNFKNGQNSVWSFLDLDQNNKDFVEKNRNNLNLLKYKNFLKTKTTTSTAFNVIPAPRAVVNFVNGKFVFNDVNYSKFYNDDYAKIVYGASIEQIQKGFKGDTINQQGFDSISSGVFSNRSVAFRSIINAAINWEYVMSKLNPNSIQELWLNGAAPDAKLGGNDQETSKYKTPRDGKDIINDLIVIDHNGNIIDKGQPDQEEPENPYSSPYFATLADAMRKLLIDYADENYGDNPENLSVRWTIYNHEVLDDKKREVYQNIVKTIGRLSPYLKPEFIELETPEQIVKVFGKDNANGNNSISQDLILSYEDDSLASYLDKITHAIGISMFPLLQKFGNLNSDDKLAREFPALTGYAKKLKEMFENKKFLMNEIYDPSSDSQNNETYPWRKITWDDFNKFNSYEERNLYLRGIYDSNLQAFKFAGLGGIGYEYSPKKGIFTIDNIAEASRFARTYLKTVDNETLINLLRELNTWRSFDINLEKWIPSLSTFDYKVTKKHLDIPAALDDIIYAQDFKITK